MPLPESRAALDRLLRRQDIALLVKNQWDHVKAHIEPWWTDYKDWEEHESFARAFADQRMTVRWAKRGMVAQMELQAARPGMANLETFKKPQPELKGPAARMAQHQTVKNYELDVGIRGVAARANPANFCPDTGGASRKAELGLHDMSASLLRNQDIVAQLFNKPEKGHLYVFMPLALPDDQDIFHRLNGLAKADRSSPLYPLVRSYRSQMTRLKLACEHDMGTNFVALAPEDKINPRFRYGIGRLTKVPELDEQRRPTGKLESDVANTPELIAARKQAAINYRQILERELFAVNEITIAYRQHKNPAFPMFAEWDGTQFCVFVLTKFGKNKTGQAKITSAGGWVA